MDQEDKKSNNNDKSFLIAFLILIPSSGLALLSQNSIAIIFGSIISIICLMTPIVCYIYNKKDQKEKPWPQIKKENDDNKFRKFADDIISKLSKMIASAESKKQAQELYRDEEVIIYPGNLSKRDETMLTWFAFGIEIGYRAFVMSFVNAYVRDRVEFMIKEKKRKFEVGDWIKSKSHLNESLKHKLNLVINAYTWRILPKFEFDEKNKISDSIINVALHILIASEFVNKCSKPNINKSSKLPFQIDFPISVNTTRVDNGDDDGNDYSDDDDAGHNDNDNDKKDNENAEISLEIADIVATLKKLSLSHSRGNIGPDFEKTKNLLDDHKEDDNESGILELFKVYSKYKAQQKPADTYPRNKRFCVFMDGYSVVIFDPPKQSNSLPKGDRLIAESFLNRSRECLIPCIDENRHIKVTNACNGKLLTLSFHVIQQDEIRCFLFWNGRCLRFYPRDICHILRHCFDMNSHANKNVSTKALRRIAERITIKDARFEAFYESLDSNSKPLTDFIN